MKNILIGQFLLNILMPFFSFSQNVNMLSDSILTYEEAIEIGMKNNIEIKKYANQLNVSKINNRLSYSGYLPTIGLSGNLNSSDGRQFDQTKGVITTNTIDRSNLNLSISLDLLDYSRRIFDINQTEYLLKSKTESFIRFKENVAYNVLLQYLQILMDEKLVEIGKINFNSQEKLYAQINEYYRLGLKQSADLYTQEAEVKRAELMLIHYTNQVNNDKLTLLQSLQLSKVNHFVVKQPDWVLPDSSIMQNSVEDLITNAIINRSDLKSIQNLGLSIKNSIRSNRAIFKPSISIFYNYGSNYSSLLVPRTINQQLFQDNIYGIYGVSINIPLLNGFRNLGITAAAKVDYENNKLDAEGLKLQIETDIKRSFNDLKAAFKTYNTTIIQLKASEYAYSIQKEKYELGQSSLFELIQSNSNITLAKASHAQAFYVLMFQEKVLQFFIGADAN